MQAETQAKRRFYRISAIVLVMVALILFVVFFSVVELGAYENDSVKIASPVDVTVNGVAYPGVDLDHFSISAPKHGDHITYDFVLPDKYVTNPVLTLYVDHSAINVLLDGESIYKKGSPDSLMLGYGYLNIGLPVDYAGKTVSVELDLIEGQNVSVIQPPVINNVRSLSHNFVVKNSIYLVIDIAIIIISLTLMFIGAAFSGIAQSLSRLVYLGMAFFLMGVWEMCNYNLVSIFSESLVLKGYMEYISLYFSPFFIAVYFYSEFFGQESPRTVLAYRIILGLQGAFPFVAMALHFTGILGFPVLLPVFHIILIVNILMVMVVLVRQALQKKSSHRSLIIGLIIMIVLGLIDIVRFNVFKYLNQNQYDDYASYLLIGFFLFLVAMVLDFLFNQQRNLYKLAQAEAMDKLAHIDIMTGLANRRRCEEVFEELKGSSAVFEIISIDINYLKVANDQYGHQEGDRLLTDFAEILKKSVAGTDAIAGRMGGDEFAIIIPDAGRTDSAQITANMKKEADVVNVDRKPFAVSFSYGGCRSDDSEISGRDENETIVEKVFNIADERMYAMKTAMKARREDVGT